MSTLLGNTSAYKLSGIVKKQKDRPVAVYSPQHSLLNEELTMAQNMTYFVRLGSSSGRLLNQMVTAFGLADRKNTLAKDLTATEKHIL